MKNLWLACALIGPYSCITYGFDSKNAGRYVPIPHERQADEMTLDVTLREGSWQLDLRDKAGDSKTPFCSKHCQLQDSTPPEIEGFISPENREKYRFQCINDKTFAFCSYQSRLDLSQGGHALVMLLTSPPPLIWMKKANYSERDIYEPGPPPSQAEIEQHLHSREAINVFANKYWFYRPNKAFASSPDGAWGHSGAEMTTPKQAAESALRWCEQSRVKYHQIAPCKIINVNGQWQSAKGKKQKGGAVQH